MRDHGTHACFVHGPNPGSVKGGCRCEPCRQANAAYERQRSRRTAPPYVAADRARQHLAALSDQGIGLKTVARLSGVSHGALSKLVYGDRTRGRGPSKRIRPATEKAILGVTAAQADGRHHTHTADDYRALLDLLVGRGWTTTAIANEIGVAHSNVRPRPGQAKVTAAKMTATRQLLDRTPITRRSRWGGQAEPAWTPEEHRRDTARKATNARATVDDLPNIDLSALAAQEWRQRAACRLLPDDQTFIFWPGRGDSTTLEAARTVCLSCPVAQDCLDWALTNGERGVWGGTSDKQRKEMRNGRRPAVAAKPVVAEVKACRHCGIPLRPTANQSKFCSRSCAMLHRHHGTGAVGRRLERHGPRRHPHRRRASRDLVSDQLELGACGATAHLRSYGRRTCVMPAGHQPPPDQPSTSTEGWHESADHIRWATDQALAARQDA